MNYVTHKDWATGKWNVYLKDENGKEEFVEAFESLRAAEDFCLVKKAAKNAKKSSPKKNLISFLTR